MCIPRGKDKPEAKNEIICNACAGALLVKVDFLWGCQSDPSPWAKLASQRKPCQSAQQRPGCVQPSFLPEEKRGRDWRPSEAVSRGSWAECQLLLSLFRPCFWWFAPRSFTSGIWLWGSSWCKESSAAGNKCQGCRKETGGIRKEGGGLCESRIGLTASVVEPRGMVSAVSGESLVKTQPLQAPPSACVLALLQLGPCQTSHSGAVLQPAAVALSTKPCVAAPPGCCHE